MFSWKEFYQKDVALGYEITLALLEFESNQVEDKLASSQDNKFLDVSRDDDVVNGFLRSSWFTEVRKLDQQ